PGEDCVLPGGVPGGMPVDVTFEVGTSGDSLVVATSPQTLEEGMAIDVCFELGLSRAGVYNIGVVIEDVDPDADTDGIHTYAGDNLAMVVAKAEAIVTIDGAVAGIVSRSYTGAAQVVTASTTAPITGSIDM